MFYILGTAIAFAVFFIVNLIVASLAAIVWRMVEAMAGTIDAIAGRRLIIILRIAPALAAAIAAGAFVFPAYWRHEPANSGEEVGISLALLAAAGAISFLVAVVRCGRNWLATRRLMSQWLSKAREVRFEGFDAPLYCISHEFPILAILGIFQAKLFVSEKVLETLTASELNAAITHELGHRHSRDNFIGACLRFADDLRIVPIDSRLERAWASSTETCADLYATNGQAKRSLDLASAIVKLARQVPVASTARLPIGAYFVLHHVGEVGLRVRQLAGGDSGASISSTTHLRMVLSTFALLLGGTTILSALHLANENFSYVTHQMIETLVRLAK